MIEIKGIIKDFPEGLPRYTVFLHWAAQKTYRFEVYPSGNPLDVENITSYIASKFSVPLTAVSWRSGITIPS